MLFQASSLLWPFTMNYPWNQSDCLNCDEPIKPIESLWQIPLHEWTYPDGRSISLPLERIARDQFPEGRERSFFGPPKRNTTHFTAHPRKNNLSSKRLDVPVSFLVDYFTRWIEEFHLTSVFERLGMFFLASQSCRTLSDASCLPDDKPYSGDLLFELLKYNFDRHVTDHRTPFVIELDLFWLSEKKDIRLEALIRFIDYILHSDEYRYAYFVSIEQALEWLKYPRPLSELQDFWAFGCKDTLYEYDIDCSHDGSKGEKNFIASNEDAQRLLAANKSNSSDDAPPMDRRAEELFRSGIVVHSIWVFLLLIITVLFYDKYFATKWAFFLAGSVFLFCLSFHYSTINCSKKQTNNYRIVGSFLASIYWQKKEKKRRRLKSNRTREKSENKSTKGRERDDFIDSTVYRMKSLV